MPDFSNCHQTLHRYLKARIPFISLRTEERDRALELFRGLSSELGIPIYCHTLSQGTRDLATNRSVNEDRSAAGALDFVGQQILQRQNLTFVLTEVQDLEADNALTRQLLDVVHEGTARGGTVVVLTSSSVWPRLQRQGMSLTSLSAKAVAGSWNLPLYRLDLANIHGQYLGQSEARLKESLSMADRVAPCVLWIDEIEKGLAGAGSSGDGGTSTRLVGHFLYWLQEGRARVFVVSTANDIGKLPPELFRRGRFDEVFFVDLPEPGERREILSLYARRYLRRNLDGEPLLDELVELSEGFAGSDLEASVAEVAKEAMLKGDEAVDDDYWRKVFRNTVPLSKTNPEAIDAIRLWGRERAVPASGHPSVSPETGQPKARRSVLV